MGVNGLTILLGVLAGGVLLANGLLGEGWLADAIDGGRTSDRAVRGDPPAGTLPSARRPIRDLPPDYSPPSAGEMLKLIPKEDLDRMLQQPPSGR